MKSSKLFLSPVGLLILMGVACQSKNDDVTGAAIVLEQNQLELSRDAQTVSVSYNLINGEYSLEYMLAKVEEEVEWLSAEVNDTTVELTVQANLEYDSRSATVIVSYPGASDVSIIVTQPEFDAYAAYLGTWSTVTNSKNTQSIDIVISENVKNESYTLSGWQRGYGASYPQFDEELDMSFTTTYDPETKTMILSTCKIADQVTIDYTDDTTLIGDLWLIGAYETTENSWGYRRINAIYEYPIAKMTVDPSSPDSASMEILTEQVVDDDGTTQDVATVVYTLRIDKPVSYEGSYYYWDQNLTWLPFNLTKKD